MCACRGAWLRQAQFWVIVLYHLYVSWGLASPGRALGIAQCHFGVVGPGFARPSSGSFFPVIVLGRGAWLRQAQLWIVGPGFARPRALGHLLVFLFHFGSSLASPSPALGHSFGSLGGLGAWLRQAQLLVTVRFTIGPILL